jgi:hypothetical protein
MNASIGEADTYERVLPWTLFFDPPEREQAASSETKIAAAQRPCGFVVVLLRAVGLANLTVRASP